MFRFSRIGINNKKKKTMLQRKSQYLPPETMVGLAGIQQRW
jgi:hypothetical protein